MNLSDMIEEYIINAISDSDQVELKEVRLHMSLIVFHHRLIMLYLLDLYQN